MGRNRRVAKIESLKRAGLTHIAKDRLTSAKSRAEAAPRAEDQDDRMEAEHAAAAALFDVKPTPPLPASRLSREEKKQELTVLADEVAACTCCRVLTTSRSRTVFSDGDPMAELCFVGEAPGYDEDQAGVPFVGRAGQLLTRIIEACKFKREEVYICNVLKCRPPENRSPMPEEMQNCRPFLERQLAIVRPKMLVALGKYAAAFILEKPAEQVPITKIRGRVVSYLGIPCMITLHPAYLLRNPAAKREVWEDMKEVMRRLGKPVE